MKKKTKQIDISSEMYRVYHWADGTDMVITNPVTLIVSEHGHRVATADKRGYYIPSGWKYLEWKTKEGFPTIVY